ncbi:MAG: erythromycin esterase family protein [Chlorobi bacterium]|nr:erythromycin esterase family protein [Chlorobiota bacterium]
MKFLRTLFGIILILLAVVNCGKSEPQNKDDSFVVWAKQNSQEIKTLELTQNADDLFLLKKIVGNAKAVFLGESRHDIHEQYLLKRRFVKYLVEELGFTTFILEASLPYAEKINKYILEGKGNIEEITANMPGWFLWDTEETLTIINWMRDYNKDSLHKKKIEFYGIDIVAPNYGLNKIFNYLNKIDKATFEKFQKKYFAQETIDDNFWPNTLQQYSSLSVAEKETLAINYNDLYEQLKLNKTKYISNSSADEYDWILCLAYCAKEANNMFSETDKLTMGLIRDKAMAENVLWIKKRANDEKIIVWAHNVHIAKAGFTMTALPGSVIKGMGSFLSDQLKDKMISIGASFNRGEFEGWNKSFPPADEKTLDGTFAKLDYDYFLIDLKGKTENEAVKDWLNTDKTLRGQDFDMTCVPVKSFDAFFFVDKVSRAVPNAGAREKFRNMN